MSCVDKIMIIVPNGVEVMINDHTILVRGTRGCLKHRLHNLLNCEKIEQNVVVSRILRKRSINTKSLLGTACSLLKSMIVGVSVGFEKKLNLVGVGYRAVIENNIILLNVGFSHIIRYELPEGVDATCSNSVDILLSSINKQLIGQVAADLRRIRPPEVFSGKGIRYANEVLYIKEVKKK